MERRRKSVRNLSAAAGTAQNGASFTRVTGPDVGAPWPPTRDQWPPTACGCALPSRPSPPATARAGGAASASGSGWVSSLSSAGNRSSSILSWTLGHQAPGVGTGPGPLPQLHKAPRSARVKDSSPPPPPSGPSLRTRSVGHRPDAVPVSGGGDPWMPPARLLREHLRLLQEPGVPGVQVAFVRLADQVG